MQAVAMNTSAREVEFTHSQAVAYPDIHFAASTLSSAYSAISSFPIRRSRSPAQTKGWAVKAHEFNNSGPPALLNNPCCCRRVVCHSFLKHAMEVHYG